MIKEIIEQTVHGNGDGDQLSAATFGIALTTRGKKFLELGVRSGQSTLPLLYAAHILGAKLTSVDIQTPTFVCPELVSKNWNFIKSEAIEFLTNNTEKYDLIFIDDWHDGIHVRKELDLLEPYCDKSTVILLHDLMYVSHPDYNMANSGADIGWGMPGEFDNGGPYRAVASLDSSKWEFATIPFNNGLTILRKRV